MNIKEAIELAGEKKELLENLADFMHENYDIEDEFKFSKKYGWNLFWRKSGKSLAIVNFGESGVQITVVIGVSLEDKIKEAEVSQKTLKKFAEAKQYFDGRWLNYKDLSREDMEDIKKLILVKKKPRKQQ